MINHNGKEYEYTALTAALRSEGVPGRYIHGLAAKYFKRVYGIWPGQRGENWDGTKF